jgi:hypothetical protein
MQWSKGWTKPGGGRNPLFCTPNSTGQSVVLDRMRQQTGRGLLGRDPKPGDGRCQGHESQCTWGWNHCKDAAFGRYTLNYLFFSGNNFLGTIFFRDLFSQVFLRELFSSEFFPRLLRDFPKFVFSRYSPIAIFFRNLWKRELWFPESCFLGLWL